jgi:hypothetical protein
MMSNTGLLSTFPKTVGSVAEFATILLHHIY